MTTPGVLRPTTRTPVLVCHPDDEEWFLHGGVLPELPRTSGIRPETGFSLHVEAHQSVPRGLALLDSPDIDSVETANHDLAAQLLGAADLWLFVTTAARYADAVPWEYLARAQERSIALSVIINRIPTGSADQVAEHFRAMLDERGLAAVRLFTVTERPLSDGRITEEIDDLTRWLADLVGDAERRANLIRTSLDGAIGSVTDRVERVASAIESQADATDALRNYAYARYDDALASVGGELKSGHLLRGEVLDQWREIVGTGAFMDRLQRGVGSIRDRLRRVFTGAPHADDEVRGELESNLGLLVRDAADRAALNTVDGWDALPGGDQALARADRGIDRASPPLGARVERSVSEWQLGVLEMVQSMSGGKLAVARTLSLGINSVGVALMIAVFSQTGGVTGGEAAVAGGTAAVSQTVLTAIFGEQAVRDLVELARDDLDKRLRALFELERDRFDQLLTDIPDSTAAAGLRSLAGSVQDLHR